MASLEAWQRQRTDSPLETSEGTSPTVTWTLAQ